LLAIDGYMGLAVLVMMGWTVKWCLLGSLVAGHDLELEDMVKETPPLDSLLKHEMWLESARNILFKMCDLEMACKAEYGSSDHQYTLWEIVFPHIGSRTLWECVWKHSPEAHLSWKAGLEAISDLEVDEHLANQLVPFLTDHLADIKQSIQNEDARILTAFMKIPEVDLLSNVWHCTSGEVRAEEMMNLRVISKVLSVERLEMQLGLFLADTLIESEMFQSEWMRRLRSGDDADLPLDEYSVQFVSEYIKMVKSVRKWEDLDDAAHCRTAMVAMLYSGGSLSAVASSKKGLQVALRVDDTSLLHRIWNTMTSKVRVEVIGDLENMMKVLRWGPKWRQNEVERLLAEKWTDLSEDDVGDIVILMRTTGYKQDIARDWRPRSAEEYVEWMKCPWKS